MYRGTWDGGPPGAEADYDSSQASHAFPSAPNSVPTQPILPTDPWTGVSYPQYTQPNYDYQYSNYNYDYSSYYSATEGNYYPSQYAPQQYNYAQKPRSRSRSHTPKDYDRKRTYSRSPSYSRKDRAHKSRRDRSYDRHSKSRSRSVKSKRARYSSEHSSSRSVSSSRSIRKKKRSASSRYSSKERGYDKKTKASRDSETPPIKSAKEKSSKSIKSRRSRSSTPKTKSSSDLKKHRRDRTSRRKKSDGTPPIKYTPDKREKVRESSITPPRCYARDRSSSDSPNKSWSLSPKRKRSSSSSDSSSSSHSHSKKKRHKKRPSSSESSTSETSRSRSRSKSKSRKASKSRSSSTDSMSSDERRGQFTVADRKRYWKKHRGEHEKRREERAKTPDLKPPPPGAVETSHMIHDIEYGDPPDVEGPNFAELLPTRDQVLEQAATSSKKGPPIPIRNDGSFLEMFKKLQEETKKTEVKPEIKKPVLPFIGKRRGGRVLKTGLVKKAKAIDEQPVDNTPKDAWSLYMQEVKKYRETSCEEEKKTRPLVK